MNLLITILLGGIAVFVTAYILPGVHIKSFASALVAAVILTLVFVVVKPILVVLTLPINILTLGLFTLVINALLVLIVSSVVPGFEVKGFWWALLFWLILSLISGVLNALR